MKSAMHGRSGVGLEFNVLDFRHPDQINCAYMDVDAFLGPYDREDDLDSEDSD
jgi:hypothetical protein